MDSTWRSGAAARPCSILASTALLFFRRPARRRKSRLLLSCGQFHHHLVLVRGSTRRHQPLNRARRARPTSTRLRRRGRQPHPSRLTPRPHCPRPSVSSATLRSPMASRRLLVAPRHSPLAPCMGATDLQCVLLTRFHVLPPSRKRLRHQPGRELLPRTSTLSHPQMAPRPTRSRDGRACLSSPGAPVALLCRPSPRMCRATA